MSRLFCEPLILSPGTGQLVLVHDEVAETIGRHIEVGSDSREAGGIFLGSHRGPHVEVLSCTVPMPHDRRSHIRFDRRDGGHQSAALARWRASQGTDTFVGEWHTHPEALPTPSAVDRRTWIELMGRLPGPFVFAIGGPKSISWYWGLSGQIKRLSDNDALF